MASVTDTAKIEAGKAQSARRRRGRTRGGDAGTTSGAQARRARRRFSSLTQRILAINLVALGLIVGGVLYLDQYQRGLIEGRLEALATQGLIIAAALGETVVPRDPAAPQRIDPRLAATLIEPLVRPIQIRARLFRDDGELIVDSLGLDRSRSRVEVRLLPSPRDSAIVGPLLERMHELIDDVLIGDLPAHVARPHRRAEYFAEAVHALRGEIGAQARRGSDGDIMLNVAVPVRRFKGVLGALMLTAGTEDIEARVRDVRGDILALGLLAVAITVLLSLYLAGTIARPIRQLAAGAERVTSGWGGAAEIPDLSRRADEIGDLSVALRAMTDELKRRVDDNEKLAADISHELRNPLSSLKSAVETIQRIDDEATRERLFAVLGEDLARMDRLITDISAASRLDAELIRATAAPVDLVALISTLVDIQNGVRNGSGPRTALAIEDDGPIEVRGVEDRLAQVFRNLLDNAVSFSPREGTIEVRLSRRRDGALVVVEDEGPGVPAAKTHAIFERFYSDRPAGEKFGTHSGLGLSISKQIIEAHKGRIEAENRRGPKTGARFTVWLPF